jgi:predicted Zn-dependent protease
VRRRDVLKALVAGTLLPPTSGFLQSCSGRAPSRGAAMPVATGVDVQELRIALRAAVERLYGRYAQVRGLITVRRSARIAIDEGERILRLDREVALALAVADRSGRELEYAVHAERPAEVAEAARALDVEAAGVLENRAGRPEAGKAESFASIGLRAPGREFDSWVDRVASLQRSTEKVGGSRVVYRSAYLNVDDDDVIFIGEGRDLHQRVARNRSGVLFLVWTGSQLLAEEVSRAGSGGTESVALSFGDLQEAADRAISYLTARTSPDPGELDVVLAPELAAQLCMRVADGCCVADAWVASGSAFAAAARAGRSIGPDLLHLVDDPTLKGGFASYFFDDEGWSANQTPLLERGVVVGPVTDQRTARLLARPRTGHGRRGSAFAASRPRPSNVVLAAGQVPLADILHEVRDGILMDGAMHVGFDPRSGRAAIRARRAREIKQGRYTGRTFGNVMVASDLAQLFGRARALSREVASYAENDPGQGRLSFACYSPYLFTRATVVES